MKQKKWWKEGVRDKKLPKVKKEKLIRPFCSENQVLHKIKHLYSVCIRERKTGHARNSQQRNKRGRKKVWDQTDSWTFQ